MTQNFKVVRYAISYVRDNERNTGLPLYDNEAEAQDAAKRDNQFFHHTGKNKAHAVEVDMTDEVKKRAIKITLQAHSQIATAQETERAILELIQYATRGY